jgi:hypothetical protein
MSLLNVFRLSTVALFASLSTACVTTTVDTYYRVPDTDVDQAYLRPGVDFSKYSELYAYPMEVYYLEGEGSPGKAEVEQIRDVFHAAFLDAIEDAYPVVPKPAAKALGVRASLVDLKANQTADDLPPGLEVLVSGGHLTFLMELIDSKSGTVLARAADQERETGDAGELEGMDAAAERWAGLFRQFLDKNLSRPAQ